MELKVWVDGIQRVVCGVSEQTTCQEVVIALARAIGQTGRYVLVQKLREKERQLLPLECPLESLAKCGQYANDVQFILRRTGPSVAERPSSEGAPQAPERTFIRASLPIKPRALSTDIPRPREPRKSMTFNLGPMGSVDPYAKSRWRQHAWEGMDLKDGGPNQPSKEELFKTVLRQQEQLHSLEAHGDTLETDLRLWEHGWASSQEDEILYLEHLVRRNDTELGEEEFWQSELRLEKECERERQERVRSLRASLEEYTHRIYELSARTEALQKEIQWEMAERAKRGKEIPVPSPTDLEDMAAKMKRDLEAKVKQGTQLESNLASVEKALEEAERSLQAQNQELEELNKELRQCNLQQFIQQTGATVTVGQARSEEDAQPELSPCELPACRRNGGFPPTGADSPPSTSTKQLLSHPRTLPEPLVPSLNTEVLYKQWMKLISTEKAAVSGMKHGSFLIMHSSSTEHFRTGREGDGTWLQI
ncbi:ras association domain-containing protein 7 isoform X1 [Coturnix japonica]|uniref:ras association domain-containing protein 7 isoform X1 n=1 Tax=Coturnix japonica TaxID=93934 RepID=UPI0007778ADA|nr:ras association domain-containing protein 7 isoform X1 [Coturnix japonica]XP_015719216.1 ras association domain-containing protein 7 isoform X1 [Coturnix japonica]XP_015719217.1 ras association domain-containing protein 7 isoform X1 [Coturnix japonica]XP_015719218.1 ras association domain-containing protein 7 isoform X1 [Coturnix japonica]XP_015719219.1 ras association domain-containing protein 7 isoform X1 [Coturnix japonica]XP_015719220.1 ras association domain-containing protein 7 isofor